MLWLGAGSEVTLGICVGWARLELPKRIKFKQIFESKSVCMFCIKVNVLYM